MNAADGSQDQTSKCPVCGAEGDPAHRFCSRCGTSLPTPQAMDPGAPTTPEGTPSGAAVPYPVPGDAAPSTGPSDRGSGEQGANPQIIQEPPKKNRRVGLVIGIVAGVIVVAGAAAGATIALSSGGNNHPSGSSSSSSSGSQAAGSRVISYSSFQVEYAAVKGAIVEIKTVGCDGNTYVGSGFVTDAHHIVTAGHVVEGSQSMTVTVNGQPVPTQIVGLDASGDVALLASDAALPAPYVPLGHVSPQVGQHVAAIGFPLAGGLTMTQGSVSALNQSLSVNNTNLGGLVQTDTALNPGNSGGPLIALDGHADGIVDALNPQANGTGYAIDPQYALAEVNHWITTPESHPLPLCSAPDPYGSGSASSVGSSVTAGAESAAATAVGSILQQSSTARGTVVAATQEVNNCTGDPATEASAMQGAIASRDSALQQVNAITPADLPDGGVLLSDLNAALQASDQADQDFVLWMGDIEGTSCPYATTSDSNYQAATAASSQADSAKQAFLALWNPVAAQFGLTQYTAGQI